MVTKLQQVATTINKLAKLEHDSHRQLCIAIAGAMDLVKRQSNLSWKEWADENLRKADGSKWATNTLYTMASQGRDPQRLIHARKNVADYGRRARKALKDRTTAYASRPLKRPYHQNDLGAQVKGLLAAWDAASWEARREFLKVIKAKIVLKSA